VPCVGMAMRGMLDATHGQPLQPQHVSGDFAEFLRSWAMAVELGWRFAAKFMPRWQSLAARFLPITQ
jgi:hypothetical protein